MFSFGDSKKRSDNFSHIERQLDFDENDLETVQTKALYQWWRSYQPNLPARADFDIVEHRSLPPYIYVMEVLSPTKFLYRLNGEHVVRLVGRSLATHTLSIDSPIYEDKIFASYLSDLITHRKACRCFGDFSLLGREHIKFESVDCPVADKEGNITHIIGVLTDRYGDGGR
ncbi:MAG: PAS domain-containing protein [Sneathiella sp.]|nr:PAS domain-containing protein [Sneathiella sp.]